MSIFLNLNLFQLKVLGNSPYELLEKFRPSGEGAFTHCRQCLHMFGCPYLVKVSKTPVGGDPSIHVQRLQNPDPQKISEEYMYPLRIDSKNQDPHEQKTFK